MDLATTLISTLGIVSALALIVYVTFLGTQAPFYEFMRRIGIYAYFLFSVIAQIMLASQALRLAKQLKLKSLARISHLQLWLALTPLALGTLNLLLKWILIDADSIENSIEWISALMMQIYFLLTYWAWRETDFDFHLTIDLRHK